MRRLWEHSIVRTWKIYSLALKICCLPYFYLFVYFIQERTIDQIANTNTGSSWSDSSTSHHVPPCQPQSSIPLPAIKTIKLLDPPEYVVHTDSELDIVRSQYFSLLRAGNVEGFNMSKELVLQTCSQHHHHYACNLECQSHGEQSEIPFQTWIESNVTEDCRVLSNVAWSWPAHVICEYLYSIVR